MRGRREARCGGKVPVKEKISSRSRDATVLDVMPRPLLVRLDDAASDVA